MNVRICMGILLILIFFSGCPDSELAACIKGWQDTGLEPGLDYVPEQAVAGFGLESEITEAEASALIASIGYGMLEFNDSLKVASVSVPAGKEFEAICKLERLEEVSYAEPNYLAHIT